MSWAVIKGHVGKWLPKSITNRIRRWRNKREALLRKMLKDSSIAQHGTFNSEELVSVLRGVGVQEGSVLFVHCSFNDMFTFAGTSMDILKALRTLVGPSGTLLMPTYTSNSWTSPPRIFDVTREVTYTGVVNEMFRRTPGVIRSLHPRHSICGEGPLAKDLLSGHELCVRADGPNSPFDRLRQRDDAYILTLGLQPGFVSILHWLEDLDPSKLPFPVHTDEPVLCQVIDVDGRITVVKDWQVLKDIAARLDFSRISKHLSPSAMKILAFKGVVFGSYHVKTLTHELLTLRDNNIIHYHCKKEFWGK